MICEHCGKEISDNAVICPSCGGVTSSTSARPSPNPTTTYGDYPPEAYSDYHDLSPTSTYDQGYAGQANFTEAHSQAGYRSPAGDYGYRPSYNPPPRYQVPPVNATPNKRILCSASMELVGLWQAKQPSVQFCSSVALYLSGHSLYL